MLGDTDLTNPSEVEILRRSIAMLPSNTGTSLLTREDALRLVGALGEALRDSPFDDPFG